MIKLLFIYLFIYLLIYLFIYLFILSLKLTNLQNLHIQYNKKIAVTKFCHANLRFEKENLKLNKRYQKQST